MSIKQYDVWAGGKHIFRVNSLPMALFEAFVISKANSGGNSYVYQGHACVARINAHQHEEASTCAA